jgi:hypothetical protein
LNLRPLRPERCCLLGKTNKINNIRTPLTTIIAVCSRGFGGQSVVGMLRPDLYRVTSIAELRDHGSRNNHSPSLMLLRCFRVVSRLKSDGAKRSSIGRRRGMLRRLSKPREIGETTFGNASTPSLKPSGSVWRGHCAKQLSEVADAALSRPSAPTARYPERLTAS